MLDLLEYDSKDWLGFLDGLYFASTPGLVWLVFTLVTNSMILGIPLSDPALFLLVNASFFLSIIVVRAFRLEFPVLELRTGGLDSAALELRLLDSNAGRLNPDSLAENVRIILP